MSINQIQMAISLIPVAYALTTALTLLVYDIKEQRLPNKIVVPMLLLTLVCWLTLAIWQGAWLNLLASLGAGLFWLFIMFFDQTRELVGGGDIKVFAGYAMITTWFLWWSSVAMFISLLILTFLVVAVVLILAKQESRVVRDYRLYPTILLSFLLTLAVIFVK